MLTITDGDHDSGVDENTQHPIGESPTKKMGSGGAATRIPKKTPPASPTKPVARSRAPGAAGGGRVPRSKSVPKPFTSWATPPSTSESAKKGNQYNYNVLNSCDWPYYLNVLCL